VAPWASSATDGVRLEELAGLGELADIDVMANRGKGGFR
jgi:hypothetical protein